MLATLKHQITPSLLALSMLALLSGLAGCADVITYSHQANAEGMKRYQDGAYDDAAGAFRQAIRQEPRDYHSHYYLGSCYDQLKQHEQAYSEYRTALQVMSQTPEGRYDADFRQQVLDTYASAVARYDQQEIELNSVEQRAKQAQTCEGWFLLGKIYRLKGDADLALDAYRRASHFDNEDFFVRKEAGLFLLDPLNKPEDAKYYLIQANRLNPDDETVSSALVKMGLTPQPAYHAPAADEASNAKQPASPIRPGRTAQLPRD